MKMSGLKVLIKNLDESQKKEMKEGIENKKWIKNNYNILRTEYPDSFIAVKNLKVIAANRNLNDLLKIVNSQYPDDNEIAIEYIRKEKSFYFL